MYLQKLMPIILIFMVLVNCRSESAKNSKKETTSEKLVNTENQVISDVSIYEAALIGNYDLVNKYLQSNTAIDAVDENGFTPLMLAAYNGHTEIVELLLKNGAEVNKTNSNKLTPLHFAASGPAPKTVQVLLEYGANIDATDGIEDFTPLMYAATEGNIEVVKILLKNGANKTLKDKDGDTAEVFARQSGHKEIANLLN